MLPEMFWSANDCACRPETDVLSASKIPITFSPTSIRAAEPICKTLEPQIAAGETSQCACQDLKYIFFNDLKKKPRSEDRGTIAGRATIAGREPVDQVADGAAG